MDDQSAMESMITSAVFLLKKYVRTKRSQITEALREEEQAVIEPAQSLVTILKEAQLLVDHLEGSVKSLDVSFKMIDKKIRDKLTMATAQQNVLRCRRNREITVCQTDSLSGNHLIPRHNGPLHKNSSSSHMSQLSISIAPAADRIPGTIRNVQSGSSDDPQQSAAGFHCPFCRSRSYTAKAPLLRHISDSHPDHYQVFWYIYKLTPEAVFSSDEIGGSSQCNYCSFRERSKAPLLRHIQENHADQYEYFVQIARLKQLKLPPNRPIAKAPTAISQQPLMPCAAPLPNHHPVSSAPVKKHFSAMTTTKNANACNARKSAQAGPAESCTAPAPLSQSTRSPDQPLSRTIQSNQIFTSDERSDHAYSCLKRPPPQPLLQPQNKIKRTRRFQAQQNKTRYTCQCCGEKFSHKNNMILHENFYCKKRSPSLLPSAQTTNALDMSSVNDCASDPAISRSSPSPSSSSSTDLTSDIVFGDASFITSVRDLDVVIPDTRQDEIFQLTKSARFKKICTDFK